MDFELLNFWIRSLNLDIRHEKITNNPRLYISLKAYTNDPMYAFVILLSEDRKSILTFLGFDTSIEYDKLTEKNIFEYLCTSSRLDPAFIKYCGFKGPHAKNRMHQKFNDYLVAKKFRNSAKRDDDYFSQEKQAVNIYAQDAISYFGKEKEYIDYKEKRKLIDKVMEKKYYLRDNLKENGNNSLSLMIDNFSQFITVYGIYHVSQMSFDEFETKWKDFINQNWSGLRIF